jgi:cytochrome c biogenesis protein
MAEKKKSILDFFADLRLAIFLLAAIALGAVLGTVIPQGEAAEQLAAGMNPSLLGLFRALQLFDVYRSSWFVLLLLLLAANLVVCSLRRFPSAWRQFRGGLPGATAAFSDLPEGRVVETQRPLPEEAARVEALLSRRCSRVTRAEADSGLVLSGEKGGFSRFGVYGVHLGVLLLIAGGLAGSLFGLKGYVEMAEGETTRELQFREHRNPEQLPFAVRCDRFTVEHYEGGAPRVFRSDLSFLEDGAVVRRDALLVNHPITHGGFRFYQASYGTVPGGRMTLSFAEAGKKAESRDVVPGDRFVLPGTDAEVEVLRAEGNLMRMGPAVSLAVTARQGNVRFWVFQHIDRIKEANPGLLAKVPLMNPDLFSPWHFSLKQTGERYYTVLQVARDPGVPLVAGGGFFLVAGLMITFFFSHRRLSVLVEERPGGSRIAVTGSSNRHPIGLERELESLMAEIRREGRAA